MKLKVAIWLCTYLIIWPMIFFLKVLSLLFPRTMWKYTSGSSDVCPMTYDEMKESERKAKILAKSR